MTLPEQLLVPPTGLSTTKFVTISNVQIVPAANSFTVKFETDAACLMAMDFWSQNDPSITTAGATLEGVARTQHTISTGALPAGDHTGKTFGFSLRMDANDVSGFGIRPYQGTVQLLGARTTAKLNALPVRWNTFGDGTRPAGGGGIGNWSSYTWAQYNPKGSTYPAP